MRQKIRFFLSGVKISIPLVVMILTIQALNVHWLSLTSAWLTSNVTAVTNRVITGYWTPDAPVQTGYNVQDSTSDDYASPRDPNEIGCSGGVTNVNAVSIHWTDVSDGDPLVKYQRQFDVPSTPQNSWQGNEVYTNPYSGFRTFGGSPGTDGTYGSRVRAFVDINGNNQLDGSEPVSEWSNHCRVTFDGTGPVVTINDIILDEDNQTVEIWGTITDNNPHHYWLMAEDSNGNQVSGFPGVVNHATDINNQLLHTWDISSISGEYIIKLEARDALGNKDPDEAPVDQDDEIATDSVDWRAVEISQDPETSITVTNSPTKGVVDVLENESFEDELSAWKATDRVQIVADQRGKIPHDGGKFVSLSPNQSLSQTIDNSGIGVRSVSFWYQVLESDGAGPDSSSSPTDPDFMVYANGQMLAQFGAVSDTGLDDSNQWQFGTVYLAQIDDEQIELEFVTTDNNLDVLLDDVSTESIVVNSDAVFTVNAQNPDFADHVAYSYRIDGRQIQGQGQSGLQFKLRQQPDDGLVEYWSVNTVGKKEDPHQIQVWVDDTPPSAVTDLRVYDENAGEYSLSFTAPADDKFSTVREYDIRYSDQPITNQTNWDQLSTPTLVDNDNLPGDQRAPAAAGITEDIVVGGLSAGETYYFAIKAVDQAGNQSAISNIATPQRQNNTELFVDSPVAINEIMYNPDGPDTGEMPAGEWVELFNSGDQPVDVAGWKLQDESGKQIEITAENADNNLNLEDEGETIVPPQGWLVVYRNGYEMLSNSGDTVSLQNQQGSIVNSYMYQGTAEEGRTEGRLVDGEEHWSLAAVATPGRANQEDEQGLEPFAKIYSVEPYNLQIVIFDAAQYQTVEYELTYDHQPGLDDEQTVSAGVKGEIGIDSREVKTGKIYLATCSSGGICMPHINIDSESIQAKLILTADNGEQVEISAELSGEFIQE